MVVGQRFVVRSRVSTAHHPRQKAGNVEMVGNAHPTRFLRPPVDCQLSTVHFSRQSGFTLVELLVSIGLTIFMLTLFAVLFQSGGNAVKNARGISEADKQVRGVVVKLKRDLENVFLGDGVSLAHIYEKHGPGSGYFTIEENMPGSPPQALFDPTSVADAEIQAAALFMQNRLTKPGTTEVLSAAYRQGIDSRGLPVEVDVDDVIAFTVRLPGNSPETVFTGRVPVRSVLDNGFNPESRFDQPDNGLFTSSMAEVIYFLRPDRPYTVDQINHPAIGVNENRNTAPATFTLYRRELLLLSDGQRQSLEFPRDPNSGVAMPTGGYYPLDDLNDANVLLYNPNIPANRSWYQHYDVSVYFGFDLRVAPTSAQDLLDLTRFTLRWNSPETIRQRRNRYGMRWMEWLGVNGDTSTPGFAPVDPDGAVPDYDHVSYGSRAAQYRMYLPSADPTAPRWHGRPTLYESTLIGSEGAIAGNYNPSNLNVYAGLGREDAARSLFNPGNHFINGVASDEPSDRRRAGGDVVLRNVLSFDVKVLNDDLVPGVATGSSFNAIPPVGPDLLPVGPPDPLDWPAMRTMRLEPRDTPRFQLWNNGATRVGLAAGNASRYPRYRNDAGLQPLPTSLYQPEFVDLGVGLYSEDLLAGITPADTPIRAYSSDIGYNPNSFLNVVMPGLYRYEPPAPNNPSVAPPAGEPIPRRVPWGRHYPARWESTGRRQSSSFFYLNTNYFLRSTYDTWAEEYYPENFLTRNGNPGGGLPPDPLAFTPPYDRPLRGVQITLRVLEPTSGIVREFQVVHRFE